MFDKQLPQLCAMFNRQGKTNLFLLILIDRLALDDIAEV